MNFEGKTKQISHLDYFLTNMPTLTEQKIRQTKNIVPKIEHRCLVDI